MFKYFLYIGFLLATNFAAAKVFYDKALDEYFDSQTSYGVSRYSTLNFKTFEKLIHKNQLTTMNATLAFLKVNYPEFFDTYVLMYHSRSLQQSSFEYPRVIAFDRSGQFVFSFNGHPSQRGFNSLEVMHFLPTEKRFEFREITFSKDPQKMPRISKPNPTKCLACHQSHFRANIDPRPNWEPYQTWPGSYGSIGGSVYPSPNLIDRARANGYAESFIKMAKQESDAIKEFTDTIAPTHPRYQWLGKFRPQHNKTLNQSLGTLNALRVGRIMGEADSQLLDSLKYTLLGLFQCRLLMATPEQIQKLKALLKKLNRSTDYLTLSYPVSKYGVPTIHTSDGLKYLFEPFGISTEDWSMDFLTAGAFSASNRFTLPGTDFSTYFMGYRDTFGYWEPPSGFTCSQLTRLSTQSLDQLFQSEAFERQLVQHRRLNFAKNKPLIQRCAKCHSQASDDPSVPIIAFNDAFVLKKQLQQKSMYSERTLIDEIKYRVGPYAAAHERMPLGSIPSTEQTDALIKYLENL